MNRTRTVFQKTKLLLAGAASETFAMLCQAAGAISIIWAAYFFLHFFFYAFFKTGMRLLDFLTANNDAFDSAIFETGGLTRYMLLFLLATVLLSPPVWIPYKIIKFFKDKSESLYERLLANYPST